MHDWTELQLLLLLPTTGSDNTLQPDKTEERELKLYSNVASLLGPL